MEIRQMATVFLIRGHKLLMMKKDRSRLIDHEFWSGIGGHLEPGELNAPRVAAYREMYEETGLTEADVSELKLRYLLLRLKVDEIRQQFVYFGEALTSECIPSPEGELHWVNIGAVDTLRLSAVIRFTLLDYFSDPAYPHVKTGVLTQKYGQPSMEWSSLVDPLVF